MIDLQTYAPPQAIESEESILAACMLGYAPEIAEQIDPAAFYKSSHGKIFSVICDLVKRKEPVELLTIVNALRDLKKLEECGGRVYLTELLNAPYAGNHEALCRIVKDKALLRSLIDKSQKVIQTCFESQDATETLDNAQREIMGIEHDSGGDCISSMHDCVLSVIEDVERLGDNPFEISGVTSGLSEIDWLTCGFQHTDLILLAARPSMGKSALAFCMAESAADNGVPVAVFSLEMSEKQLTARALAGRSRVNLMEFRRGGMSKEDWVNITSAAGVLADTPIFIDDTGSQGYQYLTRRIRKLKKSHNIGLAIIDYLQLVKVPGTKRHDLEIGDISKGLKDVAKEVGIPVIALSQLNRRLEERSDKRPQLADLRDSGTLEQDADVVMLLYRDEVYNKDIDNPNRGTAEINIAKQRNGPTKTVVVQWDERTARFNNLEKRDYQGG